MKKNIGHSFIYIALITLYSYFEFIIKSISIESKLTYILIVAACILFCLAIYYIYKYFLRKNNPYHFEEEKVTKYNIKWFILFLISALLIQYFGSLFDPTNSKSQITFVGIAITVFVAPVVEELICRGIFFAFFLKRKSQYTSMFLILLTSSLIFAILHLRYNIISFTNVLLVGFILGSTYIKTRKIIFPILIHMILNLISFF
ncbi:CPBP family intramembrane glutamic endopeptidase [Floricoccus penangensis]|uniref:CPBP family intramembrane glutamic endopeptidase n=1 Tax=Floricoccus penangensis TaxID=1859475 RepID=UPI00203E7246|nr:CPBP family intramembrane glutamic endopeptidase [Floricoccus penangensis]URZ88119.1 CPBP family intramembrane metalloprotease [Floricoccus penangensis]